VISSLPAQGNCCHNCHYLWCQTPLHHYSRQIFLRSSQVNSFQFHLSLCTWYQDDSRSFQMDYQAHGLFLAQSPSLDRIYQDHEQYAAIGLERSKLSYQWCLRWKSPRLCALWMHRFRLTSRYIYRHEQRKLRLTHIDPHCLTGPKHCAAMSSSKSETNQLWLCQY